MKTRRRAGVHSPDSSCDGTPSATLVFDFPTIDDVATWAATELRVADDLETRLRPRDRAKKIDYVAESSAMSDTDIEVELQAILDGGN